jgi:tetratricopeptide (TPR) repeat protein
MTIPAKNSFRSYLSLPLFPTAFLLLVCLVTYLPTICSGFKLDDFTYLNPDLHRKSTSLWSLFTESTNQHYNPLNIFFNEIFFSWWGRTIIPFHLLNLVLFYINGLLFYRLSLLFTGGKFTSLIAAILFILHPINAEIVNQIVFNTVLIAAAFFQLSFLAFDRFLKTKTKRSFGFSLIFALLAALTLETTWILPFYFLLWARMTRSFKEALRITFPFWGIVGCLFVIWCCLSKGNAVDVGFVQKFTYLNLSALTFAGSLSYLLVWYFQKLFIPIDHVWIYAIQPLNVYESVKYLALLAIIIALLIFLRRKFPFRAVGIAAVWFFLGFIFLLPGSLAHPDTGLVIEPYWFYSNSMGFFMFIGIFVGWLNVTCSRILVNLLIIVVALNLFLGAQNINRVAQTEKSYSEYWMAISPNPVPLTALAKIAYAENDPKKALEYYEIYLKEFGSSAYSLYQADELYASIGGLYAEMGQTTKAKLFLLRSLQINKMSSRVHRLLAKVYANELDYTNAEIHFIETIKLESNALIDKVNLADLYLIVKQEVKAIPILQELTQNSSLKGNDRRNVFAKLAVLNEIYSSQQASQETISQLIAIDPDPLSFVVLAQAFAAYQKKDQAILILEQGLGKYPAIVEFENMITQMRTPEK